MSVMNEKTSYVNDMEGEKTRDGDVTEQLIKWPSETGSSCNRIKDQGNKKMASSNMKYVSLLFLTLQNATLILIMRHVRIREGPMFMSTTAVIMSEVIKFTTCLGVILYLEGSVFQWLKRLHADIIRQPLDCLKISVPSFIYTLQNNLLYVAVSNLDAATYQVTYQLKILTTALFSVIMLKKQLSKLQWFSLVVLFAGVSMVQLQPSEAKSESEVSTEQKPWLGLIAVIISCMMSGFAGVYFEKILKGTPQTVWLRNVQLGVLGSIVGTITMYLKDGEQVTKEGFFYGYDHLVWFVICLQSFGGLLVAIVVKYADNILKGFATSASIVLSCIASIYFFDFHLSIPFSVGATLVIISVYLYSKYTVNTTNTDLSKSKPVTRNM